MEVFCWVCSLSEIAGSQSVSAWERQLLCILTSTWFVFVFNLVILVGVCVLWSACLSFAHFPTEFCMSFLIVGGSPFYILDTSHCQIFVLWISFSILWFDLSLFTCLLRNRSLYNPFYQIFFVFSAFWVMLKNICLLQCHKDDDLYFVL